MVGSIYPLSQDDKIDKLDKRIGYFYDFLMLNFSLSGAR